MRRAMPSQAALVKAISGIVVALIVSVLVYASPIATYGYDTSQKLILAAGAPGGALGQENADEGAGASAIPTAWYFVDLSGRFCQSENGGSLCPPSQIRTDRKALAQLLATIRVHGPRVVVLDVATRPAGDEDADLIRVLNTPGPPVLLGWIPDVDDIHDLTGELTQLVYRPGDLLCDPSSCAELKYARYFPALRQMTGPTARWLVADYSVGFENGRAYRVPSIGLAAAMIARRPRAIAPRWEDFASLSAGSVLPQACRAAWTETCLRFYRSTTRIFSFAPVKTGTKLSSASGSNAVSFTHLVPAPDTDAISGSIKDAVVVIGDSRYSAGDRTWSPIGEVSGAELILNEIRQFAVAPPQPNSGVVRHLFAESPFLLIGFAAIFLVQLWAHSRRKEPEFDTARPAGSSAAIMVRGTSILLFAALLSAAGFALLLWFRGIEPGSPPDIVTPFIGILLENFLELLLSLMTLTHRIVEQGVEKLRTLLAKRTAS